MDWSTKEFLVCMFINCLGTDGLLQELLRASKLLLVRNLNVLLNMLLIMQLAIKGRLLQPFTKPTLCKYLLIKTAVLA